MLMEGVGWGGKWEAPDWGSVSPLGSSVMLGKSFLLSSSHPLFRELVRFGSLNSNAMRSLKKEHKAKGRDKIDLSPDCFSNFKSRLCSRSHAMASLLLLEQVKSHLRASLLDVSFLWKTPAYHHSDSYNSGHRLNMTCSERMFIIIQSKEATQLISLPLPNLVFCIRFVNI